MLDFFKRQTPLLQLTLQVNIGIQGYTQHLRSNMSMLSDIQIFKMNISFLLKVKILEPSRNCKYHEKLLFRLQSYLKQRHY